MEKDKKDFVTVRGIKMKRIPVAELQMLNLLAECIIGCRMDRKIICKQMDKYVARTAEKYGMTFEDTQLQYQFRRYKCAFDVMKMPHKEFLKFDARLIAIPRDDVDFYFEELERIVIETAGKYGLAFPE